MKFLRLLPLLLLPFVFSHCEKTAAKVASKGDLTFAKSTFESLARGDSATMENIDWATFNPSVRTSGPPMCGSPRRRKRSISKRPS